MIPVFVLLNILEKILKMAQIQIVLPLLLKLSFVPFDLMLKFLRGGQTPSKLV